MNIDQTKTDCEKAFDSWTEKRGVWPRLTHEEIWHTAWNESLLSSKQVTEKKPTITLPTEKEIEEHWNQFEKYLGKITT